jgi:tRNA-dihydrouridine synthase B
MINIGKHNIKNPFFLAPMSGLSDPPFREISLNEGAALATTEFVLAKNANKNKIMLYNLQKNTNKKHLYCLQLLGGNVKLMADAAYEAASLGVDIIDINMGCPVKKIIKTGSGCALMQDENKATFMIKEIINATSNLIPITVKIRSGFDQKNLNYIRISKKLENIGIKAIFIHPRTKSQLYKGKSNWKLIKKLKNKIKIPVIGNGDILTTNDAYKMMHKTKCDGVMIGRGALGNPWIFKKLTSKKKIKINSNQKYNLIIKHLEMHLKYYENTLKYKIKKNFLLKKNKLTLNGIYGFRKHLYWYIKGSNDSSLFKKIITKIKNTFIIKKNILEYFNSFN